MGQAGGSAGPRALRSIRLSTATKLLNVCHALLDQYGTLSNLFHVFGAFLFFTERVRAALPVWTLVAATTFAVSLLAAYLVWTHPLLRWLLYPLPVILNASASCAVVALRPSLVSDSFFRISGT